MHRGPEVKKEFADRVCIHLDAIPFILQGVKKSIVCFKNKVNVFVKKEEVFF